MGHRVVLRDQRPRPVQLLLALVSLILLSEVVYADTQDYYSLLGVSREASTREIRQAFKKLALTMHPDKNPVSSSGTKGKQFPHKIECNPNLTTSFFFKGDPSAHEKFVKVNRAYEVLKDEDLRKKYDKYGEKGLDEQQQGGRYESWNYYRYDFGESPL